MGKNYRKRFDTITSLVTYISSGFSIVILVLIIGFIFARGSSGLSLDMLKNDYWSKTYLVSFNKTQEQSNFEPGENEYYIPEYGIALSDVVNQDNKSELRITYISDTSDAHNAVDLSIKDRVVNINVKDNSILEKIDYIDENGVMQVGGNMFKDTAKDLAQKISKSEEITSIYYKTVGGGIFGSLIATLYLIGLSIAIAMPLGLFAALYLNEIAKENKFKQIISSFIEMLAGVPSIIFGLVGVVALFPLTKAMGASGTSITLGALTVAIMLLPVIIRTVQESLLVVPIDYRSASLSLGATKTQTIFKVILPSALPGIISALILAISRIIAESAALIYTMGTFVNDSPKALEGATSLAVHIWSIMSQEQPNFELASAISIIIIVIILVLNIAVKLLAKRLNRKFGV